MTAVMEVLTRRHSNVTIVIPEGNLRHDDPVVEELYDSVRQTLDAGCSKILIDFSAVSAIDATGVSRLTRALTSTSRVGGTLKLLNVPPHIYDLLKIIRLHDVFEFFDDEIEAVESFDRTSPGPLPW